MKDFWDYCHTMSYSLWVQLKTKQECDELIIKHMVFIRESWSHRISASYCAYKILKKDKEEKDNFVRIEPLSEK